MRSGSKILVNTQGSIPLAIAGGTAGIMSGTDKARVDQWTQPRQDKLDAVGGMQASVLGVNLPLPIAAWTQVANVSLAAGSYLLIARATIYNPNSGAGSTVDGTIGNLGATVRYARPASVSVSRAGSGEEYGELVITEGVVFASPTTVYFSLYPGVAMTALAASALTGLAGATSLQAIRIA